MDNRRARLQVEAAGILPEEVLVLETAGDVADFIVATRNIPGMEWLGEIEEEDIPPDDDFFALDSKGRPKPGKSLKGRIFLVFTNQQALEQMLSLWNRWQRSEALPHGQTKWRDVFSQLRAIRPWGVHDRLLETGVLDDWKERVAHNAETVPCEIELWFRRDRALREAAQGRVITTVEAQRGRILGQAVIEEIGYHALLAELPVAAIGELIEGRGYDTALVQCEQIQFFRATGQMAVVIPEGDRIPDDTPTESPRAASDEPIVALLDGLPLQSHQRLVGRLIVDDPDDYESVYQASDRRHGTAMASLILHGDLNANEAPLPRPIYVRPILRPDEKDWITPRGEAVAEKTLLVDLIFRAVRRLFEGEGSQPPVARSVSIINLSVGNRDRLFDGALSPLAKLVDWLAWRYKVLFIVSSGNHAHSIDVGVSRADFAALDRPQVQDSILKAVAGDARHRRLLSPAEAINAVTVGATHSDLTNGQPIPRSIDPFLDPTMPSPINAQGMGFRRAIKPDVLASGGRVVLHEEIGISPNAILDVYTGTLPPGHRVAAPGRMPGDTAAAWHIRGTSDATALVSRSACILFDVLGDLRDEPGGGIIDMVPAAIWLKALIVHSAEWGPAGSLLEEALKNDSNSRQFREYVTRLLGYGNIRLSTVAECTAQRVTALGGGTLGVDQSHIHRFPLPPSLSGWRGWRRLSITLAWFTPVNPWHRAWRRADLWFNPPKEQLRIDRAEADWRAVQRGTVQHEILEGEHAAAFVDGENLEIQVSCRAEAEPLEEVVPYALAITLEVKEESKIQIYDEVRVRVQAEQVRITETR